MCAVINMLCKKKSKIVSRLLRLKEFREKTEPLLALFEEKNLLVTVDGNQPVEDVYRSVRDGLKLPLK